MKNDAGADGELPDRQSEANMAEKKLAFEGKQQLRWLQMGDCFLTYMEGEVELPEPLWQAWLEALAEAPGGVRLLHCAGDIKPSKEQWRRATRLMRDAGRKIAVVTDSRPTSAMVKAASWLGIEMQAFRWEQLYDAFIFLEMERQQRVALRATMTALRDAFGAKTDAELGAMSPPAQSRPGREGGREKGLGQPSSRPAFSPSRPASAPERKPSPLSSKSSDTPMATAASRNLENVRRTSEEIQAKLAEIQARLRKREPINVSKG